MSLSNIEIFHTNTGHDAAYEPRQIRSVGFNGDRIVAQAHLLDKHRDYIKRCHEHGVAIVLCFARESFENAVAGYRMTYGQAINLYTDAFISPDVVVDYWEIGNEFRGGGYESWTLSDEQVNDLLLACVPVIRAKHQESLIIAPSTVDGQPSSYAGVRLDLVDFLNPHFYAQTEESIDGFLDAHKEQARRTRLGTFFLTEGGWPNADPILRGSYIQGMMEKMDLRGDVYGVGWYNYESRQHHPQPFYVVDNGQPTAAVAFLRDLRVGNAFVLPGVARPPEPPPLPFYVGSGVREIVRKHNLTVIGPEDYFNTNASLTPAEPKSVLWVQSAGKGYLLDTQEA